MAHVGGAPPIRVGRSLATALANREHLLLGAIVMLSLGNMHAFGMLSATGIVAVVAALLFMARALYVPDVASDDRMPWVVSVAACGLATAYYARPFGAIVWCFALGLTASTAAMVVCGRRYARLLGIFAAANLVALTSLAWHWGKSQIDVYASVHNGADAVLHGRNPYVATVLTPNQVTPDTFVNQSVHFPYLPGVAILAAPGQVLGDVRVMAAVAIVVAVVAAVLLTRSADGGSRRPQMVLALCLALPLTTAMILQAWVDVYSVAGFAAWLALRGRHPRWAVVCLAISLAIKPTMVVVVVPLALWSRGFRRDTAIAVALVALLTLPFVLLTGPAAFFDDVVGVQGRLGFRYDGLTLGAAWYAVSGQFMPLGAGLVVGASVAWLALKRRPRTVSDLLIAAALLSTGGFLVAKWAFLNYYFVPLWLLLLALAARGAEFDKGGDVSLPMAAFMARQRGPKPPATASPPAA